jgi:hypothetical protein
MKRYGQQLCDVLKGSPSSVLGSTYYDAEKVFQQIAAYFPAEAATWTACAQRAEVVYRDNYVEQSAADGGGYGAVPGYWAFTDGLRRDFEMSGDTRSKTAVDQLAKHAAFCSETVPLEWTDSASLMREVAYCLNAHLDNEALGAGLAARADLRLAQLLDHIDATITGRYKAEQDADVPDICKAKTYAQPFYIGLVMKTLIEWNSVHPDSRIQPAIKKAADFMWDKLRYNPTSATAGARFWYGQCSATPGSPWNVWTTAGGNLPADDLNLLFAPAYAWLYAKTGDAVYRDRGDQIWTVGVNDAAVNGLNSKQFNQNYLWSFDYVKYRSQ